MNGAQDAEIARHWNGDIGSGARLLVAGIEVEFVGIDIGVMPQVSVVIDDLHRFAAPDSRPFCDTTYCGSVRPAKVPPPISATTAVTIAAGIRAGAIRFRSRISFPQVDECRSASGPAVFVGWRRAGWRGAVKAALTNYPGSNRLLKTP
jgi:hypothetical protein